LSRVAYVTFNDLPGGIFTSQVTDTCAFLKKEFGAEVQLISFISLRKFSANRKKIKEQFDNAVVLPMWPGVRNWKMNATLLRRYLGLFEPTIIIARGPFASVLSREASAVRVCFDARGAYVAEFSEYDVSSGKIPVDEIRTTERLALTGSHCQIAVSNALLEYWNREFDFIANLAEVIPCTLSAHHVAQPLAGSNKQSLTRIVFAGGNGKWQSVDHISSLLMPVFESNANVELTLLMRTMPEDFKLKEKFPERVKHMWLDETEVPAALAACDYGWMYREQSVTNQVASPVKFAEYLAAGLSVIISENLGDFSSFVQQHGCGAVVKDQLTALPAISDERRAANRQLAQDYFLKRNYIQAYKNIVQ